MVPQGRDVRVVPRRELWARRLVRAFGAINALFGVLGLYLLAWGWTELFPSGRQGAPRYLAQAFYAMTFVDAAFLVVTLISVPYLLRLRRSGLTICNWLFGCQVAYNVMIALVWMAPVGGQRASAIQAAVVGATGIGGVGLAPEGVFVYPIIGLVFLNLAYRRLSQGVARARNSGP
jgi:hypothetical protein